MINGWRAIAHTGHGQHLLYVGMSSEYVVKNFHHAFYDLLDKEERSLVTSVLLERWKGRPNSGYWVTVEKLRVPSVDRFNKDRFKKAI